MAYQDRKRCDGRRTGKKSFGLRGKRVICITLCVGLLAALAGCGQETPEPQEADAPETSAGRPVKDVSGGAAGGDVTGQESGGPSADTDARQALQNFSYELFAGSMEQENPVLSPVSAYLALGLAGAGAEGETGQEFEAVLGSGVETFCGELMKTLEREAEGMQVTVANSAWVDEELEPEEDWTEKVTSLCDAEMFHRQLSSEKTREELNGWISRETGGLIPQFLTAPLPVETRLALLNAVYFNGKWRAPFEARSTAEREFTNTAGDVVQVDMMHAYSETRQYLKSEIAEGVELPYRDGYSFVALKPAGELTVREMYGQLSMEDISKMREEKEERLINLRLPKFEISFDLELNGVLADMGLEGAFDPERADFTGIGVPKSGNPLYIDLVRQKAVIRVDEEGTEAAAVTMVAMDAMGALREDPPIDVFFDEPFLYMIVEDESGIPLFMGIVDDPAAGGNPQADE